MELASQMGWEHELSQAPTCHSTWKTGPASVSCPWALSCTVTPAHGETAKRGTVLTASDGTGLSDPHLEATGSGLCISKGPLHGLHPAALGAVPVEGATERQPRTPATECWPRALRRWEVRRFGV